MRQTWDEYFMDIVDKVSSRSTCLRRKVGAVITRNNHILSCGYNGPPSGVFHCKEGECIREILHISSGDRLDLCVAAHAEQNSIAHAAKYGIPIDGSMIYTSAFPCSWCMKMIINAGIIEVVYQGDYNYGIAKGLADGANLTMRRIKDG